MIFRVQLYLPAVGQAEGVVHVEHPEGLAEGEAPRVERERQPLLHDGERGGGRVAAPCPACGGEDIELPLRAFKVLERHANHAVRALDAFAPIADEVVDMREVGAHGQYLIHGHQRDIVFDGGLERGVALLHDVAIVVIEIVVQLPERWSLRAAGIAERKADFSECRGDGRRGEEVVVATAAGGGGVEMVREVEAGVLIAQADAELRALAQGAAVLHEGCHRVVLHG